MNRDGPANEGWSALPGQPGAVRKANAGQGEGAIVWIWAGEGLTRGRRGSEQCKYLSRVWAQEVASTQAVLWGTLVDQRGAQAGWSLRKGSMEG